MWARTFDARLASWNQLRSAVDTMPVDQCLHAINAWWVDTPWRAYHLHWDDQPAWPDPWQLLDDNLFCGLARGLGMLYTISLLDRPDIQDAELIDTGSDNLVLVEQKKYILNWDRDQLLNINLTPFNSRHRLSQEQLKTQIK
jgi:hypothetical protein